LRIEIIHIIILPGARQLPLQVRRLLQSQRIRQRLVRRGRIAPGQFIGGGPTRGVTFCITRARKLVMAAPMSSVWFATVMSKPPGPAASAACPVSRIWGRRKLRMREVMNAGGVVKMEAVQAWASWG
jgi:hypothetical protein